MSSQKATSASPPTINQKMDEESNAGLMMEQIPSHVAIIMDGNGRWAKKRHTARFNGHRQGVEVLKHIIAHAGKRNVKEITFFGFSSENWQRPMSEVEELMNLLRHYLRYEVKNLHKKGACLKMIGAREGLAQDILSLLDDAEALTKDNQAINVNLALNYGGKMDMVMAARHLAKLAKENEIAPEAIDETMFQSALMSAKLPEIDLLIRTSGESRISNFLLWQLAYSEFYFTPCLWPDFNESELDKALQDYAKRHRRFGAV